MKTKSVFAMDGVSCVKTEKGDVIFKKRTFTSWLIIVLLGGVVSFILVIVGDSLLKGNSFNIRQDCGSLVACFFLGGVIITLIRRMLAPPIRLDVTSKIVEIGEGASARHIPFSQLTGIFISRTSTWTNRWHKASAIVYLTGGLEGGEKIRFGSLSGDEDKTWERGKTIAYLLAETTGTRVHTI